MIVADNNAETADKTAAAIGGHVHITDVSDQAQVGALVATTADRFGQIDILVNDAAMLPPFTLHRPDSVGQASRLLADPHSDPASFLRPVGALLVCQLGRLVAVHARQALGEAFARAT